MLTTSAAEATDPPPIDLDEVCAVGTDLAWSFALLLLIGLIAVAVWGGTRDAGYATPRDPGATQQEGGTR